MPKSTVIHLYYAQVYGHFTGGMDSEKTRERAQKDPKNVEISSNERLIMEK
ncbi:hypothetical protein PISMIDRAFT_685391 [Pisolithus microcarpus 441]|uniref:Unplaced genomic scaffold scaffold_148, whole genome shotgun sequence n=1 Tax=Pisolithus microcarpus 441 TaxID=765257 RepID=A0A0C9YL05_9AGAM|nr:hypothetical protein PISMIDRAFT_685391 [Pisolithus microcarpus 441]